MKLITFFLVKELTVKKARFSPKYFWKNCAFYGLDTEQEPEPER
jgi:hypothetical protein